MIKREIIGETLSPVMNYFGIEATKTYSGNNGYWRPLEVWTLSEQEYEKMQTITDEQWEAANFDGSWWRGAEGSNLGVPDAEFIINGNSIFAWEDKSLRETWYEQFVEDNEVAYAEGRFGHDDFEQWCQDEGRYLYPDLLEYLCEEIGASTERNVCALVTDLAKYNDMTIAELFQKYGEA